VDPAPVVRVIRQFLDDGTLVVPVAALSPEAAARDQMSRFRGLPPLPEVPGLTVHDEPVPPGIPQPEPADEIGEAEAVLGSWVESGVALEDPDA